jgi:hypothetical protein
MKSTFKPIEVPGEIIKVDALRIRKAEQFANYLVEIGAKAFTRLDHVRREKDSKNESVIFSISVERPQILVHPIEHEELLAAIFTEADDVAPELISLRPDFPNVPHTNLRDKG